MSEVSESFLDIAFQCASNGWRVFPLAQNKKAPPCFNKWQEKATIDEFKIKEWWSEWPEANVGIATGLASGLMVLDVDVKNGIDGFASLNKLKSDFEFPFTFAVDTPSGGLHLYFTVSGVTIGNAVGFLPGLDIRGEGGYIVAVGSVVNGKKYLQKNDTQPLPCPPKLIQLLKKFDVQSSHPQTAISPLSGVPKGKRNNTIYNFACQKRNQGLHIDEATILVKQKAKNCSPPLDDSEALSTLKSAYSKSPSFTSAKPVGIDANELWNKDIKEPDWIIPGILPQGLCILAGKPKSGKSWLGLDISMSIAVGSDVFDAVAVPAGAAMCLTLEDTEWRLQSRLKQLHPDDCPPLNTLKLFPSWPKADVNLLRQYVGEIDDLKIVVVDTLARFRAQGKKNSDLYTKDYEDISQLKAIADEFGITVLIIHHLRKSKSSDPFEMVSGTLGLTGAADTLWVLEREPNSQWANLHIQGRDVEEASLCLEFDNGHWRHVGTYEFLPSDEELKIIKVLKNAVLTPKEVAKMLCENHAAVSKRMQRMYNKSMLTKVEYGKYATFNYVL